MKKILFAIPLMMVIAISNINAQSVKKQPAAAATTDRQATDKSAPVPMRMRADKPGTTTTHGTQQANKQVSPATSATGAGTTTGSDGTVKHKPAVMR